MINRFRQSKLSLAVISLSLPLFSAGVLQAADPVVSANTSSQVQTMSSPALGLLEAWQQAEDADTQWRSAQASLAAQREILPQARAALLPSISTSAGYYQMDYDPSAPIGSTTQAYDGKYTSYSVELRQPLLNMSAIKNYSSSKKTIDIVNYQLDSARQSLILRVSQAYFDLLLAGESVSLAEAELRALERQLEQTQQRFKVGLVSKTDVLEAQAAFDQTKVTVAQAANDKAIAQENLSIIIGQPVSGIVPVKADIPLTPMDLDMNAWVEQVLAGNISLKLAKLNQDIAGLSRDAQKASYWPTIDAVASYSNEDQVFEADTNLYGIQATWQPFQGGGLRSRIREAELQYQSALTDVAGLKQTLSRDARNLYQTLRTDIVQIEAQQQAIISNESALEATRAGYEVGTRNIVDVLDAQQALFQAKRDFAAARYTWLMGRLQADYLESSLSEASLAQIDQLLNK